MALDVGGDNHRLDGSKRELPVLTPSEELSHGLGVGRSGVRVPNVRREELEEPLRGSFSGLGNEDRNDWRALLPNRWRSHAGGISPKRRTTSSSMVAISSKLENGTSR